MSRAASKSRADKTKGKDSDRGGTQSVAPPPDSKDVIPGRFTEADWNHLLDKEEGEDFVVDIVEDIVNLSLDVIYSRYIDQQLYPYTLQKAKDAILQIIEWQFLNRDEGEPNPEEDLLWQEEDEPVGAIIDSWAQGSVPMVNLPPSSPVPSEPDTEITTVTGMSRPASVQEDLTTTVNETGTEEELRSQLEAAIDQSMNDQRVPGGLEPAPSPPASALACSEEAAAAGPFKPYSGRVPTAPVQQMEKSLENFEIDLKLEEIKKRKSLAEKKPPAKWRPYQGKVKSAKVKKMTESLDETEYQMLLEGVRSRLPPMDDDIMETLLQMPASCHSILRVQAGRPPGTKDVTYDQHGNVVSITKINPAKLPSHRVKTRFTMVDPALEAEKARLAAMKGTFRPSKSKASSTAATQVTAMPLPLTTSNVKSVDARRKGGSLQKKGAATSLASGSKIDYEEGGVTPLPPPMIDSMNLSAGVVVREGNRVRKGPSKTVAGDKGSIELNPVIAPDSPGPLISVTDILTRKTPILRPLPATEPVPPIQPPAKNAVLTS